MSFATFADSYLIPTGLHQDRLSRLSVYLCMAATAAAFAGAALTYGYGHESLGTLIFVTAFSLPLGIVILNWTGSAYVAGHYLVGNVFVQSIVFAAEPTVGTVALVGVAAGAALLTRSGGVFWIAVIVVRCIYVASSSATEVESATAAVAALVSVVVFAILSMTERSRELASFRARTTSRHSNQQFTMLRTLVNDHFDAHILLEGGQISFVSPSIGALLGYNPDELISRPFGTLLHPDGQSADTLLDHATTVDREELRLRHADGRWIWVEAYIAPDLRQHKENVRNVVLRDYEQQKKVTDQLLQAQRLDSMGTIAAAVAHDFNNLLTVILGMADDLPDGEPKREISRAAASAASLTNKLLSFGHGHLTNNEVLDLSYVIREQSDLVRHALDSRYMLIESYQEDPVLVRIDQGQYEQVFLNLVNNAREAMPDGGELEISLYTTEIDDPDHKHAGDYAVIELRDTGCGMSDQVKARAFDPFFSTKTDKPTSGLGLSSCYGIVSQYGGFIDIDSEKDQGTTISLYLPIAETRNHEPVLEMIDNDATIMVVDDDPGVLAVVRKALARAGYRVRAFTESEAAVEFFDRANICAVVTDVVMPGASGADLVSQLRRIQPDLPVLFISGFTQDHLNDWHLSESTMYLAKPFRGEEVAERIKTLLKHAPATSRVTH